MENFDSNIRFIKVNEKIKEELNYLGYNFKYYGTMYILEVIQILYDRYNGEVGYLEKTIYPIVAKNHNKTVNNIKCNIVNATDIMICECEESKLIKYLGYYNFSKPGPKKIIEAILNKIKYIETNIINF